MFKDRKEAGELLAKAVAKLGLSNVIVLGIPRGGVPVAEEVASALGAQLDLVITRKIGAPSNPEFAIGAVTQDGEPIIDEETIRSYGISKEYLHKEAKHQAEEVRERMRKYRGNSPYPDLRGKTVVIVDDGIATGNTTRAAIRSVKRKNPSAIILATPVAPYDTLQQLETEVDRVVCLDTPEVFYAIGEFYENFNQVEDDEVREILRRRAGVVQTQSKNV
jgi:putative phosphoribosyl transferase